MHSSQVYLRFLISFLKCFIFLGILVELSFSNGKKGNKFTHLKIRSNSSYFWSFFCTKYSSASSYSLSGVAGASSLANMKGSINKPVLDNSEEHADVVPRCAIFEVNKEEMKMSMTLSTWRGSPRRSAELRWSPV